MVRSWRKRYRLGIIKRYHDPRGILLNRTHGGVRGVVTDFLDTVYSNIDLFLKDKHSMDFELSTAKESFPIFCEIIGAKVDVENALKHFEIRYNAST